MQNDANTTKNKNLLKLQKNEKKIMKMSFLQNVGSQIRLDCFLIGKVFFQLIINIRCHFYLRNKLQNYI